MFPRVPLLLLILLILDLPLLLVHASAIPLHDNHDHSHDLHSPLPGTWYHQPDHPAHALFRRAPPNDGVDYPPVGSQTWLAAYPASSPVASTLPTPWVNSLNAAIAAGRIPTIPQTTGDPGTNPVYPTGIDPSSPTVCSGTYKCRNIDDIWDAPPGYFGTGFDDGPSEFSTPLGRFLQDNNETATHFLIGLHIRLYPTQFQFLFETLNHDIAVHTYTHPYMTKLTNLDIVAELGWSMQLIHDSTGGRLPRYWRPPYGDADNRVRAIAKEVFGLRTIFWNQDTGDWGLSQGPNSSTTLTTIANSFQTWATGSKTPGLIVLEHELVNNSLTAFINAYPVLKSNGWTLQSVAQLAGAGSVYQNSQDAFSPVSRVSNVLAFTTTTTSTSTSATSTLATSLAASVTPSVSMIPQRSAANARWYPSSWTTHLPLVMTLLIASISSAHR